MDPLSNLPPECLHQILQFLADDNTTISPLISLLSANKYIASNTLPYIYADINKLIGGYSLSSINARMRRSLVRMLLQRVLLDGRGDLSEMLMLLYGFEKDDISHNSNDSNDNNNKCNTASDKVTDGNNVRSALAGPKSPFDYLAYIRHLNLDIEHVDPQYGPTRRFSYRPSPQKETALKVHFAAYDDIFMSQSKIRGRYEGAIIYWEVTWSIANPILEQLESLTIPLADIKRYMDAINRLGQLETVRFNLDDSLRPQYKAANGPHYVASDHMIKSMQTMVPFIKEHQSLFKDKLKSVSLTVRSLGTDGFKWAVQEKKAMLDRLCRNGKGGQLLFQKSAASSHLASNQSTHGLVPLSSIHIDEFSTVEEIDDIVFAFSQTLESLTVFKYLKLYDSQPPLQIGQGWIDLPLLTNLNLQGCWTRLDIDRNLLSHFPNLVCLDMADYTSDYNCSDIVSCSAASLKSLEELELVGWPALTFHPETLSSTKRIKTLRMMTRAEEDDWRFIPPLEELVISFGGGVIEERNISDGDRFFGKYSTTMVVGLATAVLGDSGAEL
ncbi:hypothetical protein EC991_005042 [Linnemannia zychae]|nr:hypothetical protein EC991_005042 [Linnemannia zychae]